MVIDSLQKWYNGHIFGSLTGFFFGKETKEFFQELGDIWIDGKWEKKDFIHNTLYNSIFNRNSTNFVQFILTRRCNIKCPSCNVPLSANYEIPLQEWKDIISLLDEHFNPKLISISGGEPLLRQDDLTKIISQCTDKNIPTSLNTNGLLLNTSIIRELRDAGLTLLAVSYDGIKPKSSPKIIDNAISGLKTGNQAQINPNFPYIHSFHGKRFKNMLKTAKKPRFFILFMPQKCYNLVALKQPITCYKNYLNSYIDFKELRCRD